MIQGRNAPDSDDETPTPAALRADFADRELPRHLALFYDGQDEQLAAATAFVDYALQSGHRCVYLYDDNVESRIETALRAIGIDVEDRIEAGDLWIEDASERYLENGFDPDRMIDTLERACEAAVDDGYEGLFVAGENSWCFHTEETFDHVLEFEAQFDTTCPELPVTALCQYDLARFGEESIAKALWTHERIIYRNTICENPYYVPPERYRSQPKPELNARLMLEQTYDLSRTRQVVENREQRLTVVNRVLRHNIRNDLNTALGMLETLADDERLEPTEREWVEAALDSTRQVVEIADKARYVQRTVEEPRIQPLSLADVVDRARERVADEHDRTSPDSSDRPLIEVSGPVDQTILTDPSLEAALAELFSLAVSGQGTGPVRLAVGLPSERVVELALVSETRMLEPADRRALELGEETPLEHGSGLGIWLIKWVVENSHGTLSFPEAEDRRLAIELPRLPPDQVGEWESDDGPASGRKA
ncbi:Signal transduction histidine kinase [Halobiforma haloterrestris]|uniref:Signal transduction histidine kinase n=1 Tax=Natronobacterium haloterrestre TaxID=148448 RepID=A0A1I1D745_NATHA|nr:MEDS domain-containing protein [Halobiforma haloterrestris]SFB70637.1 Signal transduction histidine kinase [Halobiforma haloterrestris]